ncbi:flagellar biosynthesis protein FlhF [Halomonas sp. EGI 63088]|uniref:Flagellar biosynthesis protein FlhF n=1 Tax=Halomonas flagellata TaxID=2920385 RepID=A0ABS9RT30_9GAMM|nr:flagellar biosynthesis protein FlhF [Halomonas flagellata]MCH4562992.1 flagellar biosynthesis protein FlhF [Halomonas flagellata]
MSVMRFIGASSREAMRQVRAALGDDALILANRRTETGVEILALADQVAEAMAGSAADSRPAPLSEAAPRRPVSPPASGAEAFQATSAQLLREMQDMRALLSRSRAEQAPEAGRREQLAQWLAEAGFGRAIGDELLAGLPQELQDAGEERLLAWLGRQLSARLAVLDDEASLLDQGGILALVGPTGVGKTTTTAKLAARYVMRHGPDQVALVTTDSFRIGAHEQLRIYAGLLDIPMHALDAEQPLDELLAQLADKRFVIIDTVGMSQRDRRIIEQVARLQGGPVAVRLVLLLNAASQPETLEEVITNYRQAARAAGASLDDCVISKQDEAGRTGPLLDALMRHGLRLLFVAHGQRVPEDLAVADAAALVCQALATRRAAPAPEPASTGGARELLGQGRRLSAVLAGLRRHITGFAALEAAWALSALPTSLQGERLDALFEAADMRADGMLWTPRARVRGGDWSPPDLPLDAAGDWSALPLPQHRQPAGQAARLDWAERTHGAAVHLLPTPPDDEARAWLAARDGVWVAQARATQRVAHAGERHALGTLADLAAPLAEPIRRLKGCETRIRLARLSLSDETTTAPLRAWFADLEERESGRRLGRRCWLAPEWLGDEAVEWLLGQLDAEALPRLTRRAHRRLEDAYPALTPALRLSIAAGLAAVAGQLERSEAEWAMDLRAELLGLLGGRRRRSAETLLEALLYLGVARDAIRQLGAAGLEGLDG